MADSGTPSRPLEGKVALVTGGGQQLRGEVNIGLAICVGLADAGASIAVLDRDPAASAETVAVLADKGVRAIAVDADISDEGQCEAAVKQVLAQLGQLDVLINNCAIVGPPDGLETVSEEIIDAVLGVNLKGTMFMSKHALPALSDGGAIVNLSSIAATKPGGGSIYPISKGGVETLTKVTALTAGARGIRVNAVAPGLAWTPNAWRAMPEDSREQMRDVFRKASLLGIEGTAEDIATAVVFLAWAPWISGQILTVDGGGSLVRPK